MQVGPTAFDGDDAVDVSVHGAGSCGRADMWAQGLSVRDRQAMALSLQAQTLGDTAKVTADTAPSILHALLTCSMPDLFVHDMLITASAAVANCPDD